MIALFGVIEVYISIHVKEKPSTLYDEVAFFTSLIRQYLSWNILLIKIKSDSQKWIWMPINRNLCQKNRSALQSPLYLLMSKRQQERREESHPVSFGSYYSWCSHQMRFAMFKAKTNNSNPVLVNFKCATFVQPMAASCTNDKLSPWSLTYLAASLLGPPLHKLQVEAEFPSWYHGCVPIKYFLPIALASNDFERLLWRFICTRRWLHIHLKNFGHSSIPHPT